MRRMFWLAMGVTVGALAVRRMSRAAQRMSPQGIAGSVGAGLTDLADSIRDFTTDVRSAMSEREAQLRTGTGMDGALGKQAAGQHRSENTGPRAAPNA